MRASRRGARVAGFDISEEMVKRTQAKVPDGNFRAGDLNAQPYDDDTFNVVIASECLFLSSDPVGAIREFNRVCNGTGRVGIAVFAGPEISEESRMISAVHAILPEPPKISLLSLSPDGVLEDLITKAGLKTVDARTLYCSFRFDSFDAFGQ